MKLLIINGILLFYYVFLKSIFHSTWVMNRSLQNVLIMQLKKVAESNGKEKHSPAYR